MHKTRFELFQSFILYATLFAVHQQQQKIYEKKRERKRNNQKTNISKKQHSNYKEMQTL